MDTGIELEQAFLTQSVSAKGEVGLFRAFIRAFDSLGTEALAKEYHGQRYQVTFQNGRGAGRPKPRCELCDVLIIYYPEGNPSAARITFNQAKVASKPFGCHLNAKHAKKYRFQANLEQWDLLSNRPLISPATRSFRPPPDLLYSALLPSVGTFGIFYPVGSGYDFAYFVAKELRALNNNNRATGTLQWDSSQAKYRKISGHTEVTSACCMQTFGNELELGFVGTPIAPLLTKSTSASLFPAWLADVLVPLRYEYRYSQLPGELLQGLGLEGLASEDSGFRDNGAPGPAKAVILLRTGGLSGSRLLRTAPELGVS